MRGEWYRTGQTNSKGGVKGQKQGEWSTGRENMGERQ